MKLPRGERLVRIWLNWRSWNDRFGETGLRCGNETTVGW